MTSKVFFINHNEKLGEYEKIEKILKNSEFYDNLNEKGNVILNVNPRDLDDCDYIHMDTLNKIKDELSKRKCETIFLVEDRLYFSRNSERKIEDILIEKDVNLNDCSLDNDIVNINVDDENVPLIKNIDGDMIVFSHFKGNSMIGFSGAIKNFVTSCTGIKGQEKVHKLAKPFISKIGCLACNVCVKICPNNAISLEGSAKIDQNLCDGCNFCIEKCPTNAIKLNKLTADIVLKNYSEYAKIIMDNKKDNKVLFINNLIKIEAYYDCDINTKKIISEDVGILASYDPVALDKASYDLINENSSTDKFKEVWHNVDGTLQLTYGEEIGLGLQDYKLITI